MSELTRVLQRLLKAVVEALCAGATFLCRLGQKHVPVTVGCLQVGNPADYSINLTAGTGSWGLPADMPANRWGMWPHFGTHSVTEVFFGAARVGKSCLVT